MARRTPTVGDRVVFLDDVGGGVVLRATRPGHLLVRNDEGFELEMRTQDIVMVPDEHRRRLSRISDHHAGMVAANDVLEERRARKRSPARTGRSPKRPEDAGVAEVDLHLHELVDDATRLSDGEKLEFQIRYFERALESAIRDGKRRLVVIHGVGEGVLREEVRRILGYYQNVRFHDADMRHYGSGATQVEILRQS